MAFPGSAFCQNNTDVASSLVAPSKPLPEALGDQKIKLLTTKVDLGLAALAKLQEEDGSFPTKEYARPAITSLAIMAYLSRGHKPSEGPYGTLLDKAVNFILASQKKSGIFAQEEVNFPLINTMIPATGVDGYFYGDGGAAKTYCHGICMLMLGEVYGLTSPERGFRIRNAIEKGLKCTLQLWDIRQGADEYDGGFRYTRPWRDGAEGDLSITGWHAASIRSIRNAGFDVPQKMMDRVAAFVLRTQNSDGGFGYIPGSRSTHIMTSAGSLCMALAGKHDHPSVKKSCRFLKDFDSDNYRHLTSYNGSHYPYYTCYYMTQFSIQMGGQLWKHCMNECYDYLIRNQDVSGLWQKRGRASHYGPAYSTSMAIIALTPPLQLLPIYQR
jgi:hypothetical protein